MVESPQGPAVPVPPVVLHKWLLSFPRLLWQLGQESPVTSHCMLRVMLGFAQRHNAAAADGSVDVLQQMCRQCAPLLAAARKDAPPADAADPTGVWCPWRQDGSLGSPAHAHPRAGHSSPHRSFTARCAPSPLTPLISSSPLAAASLEFGPFLGWPEAHQRLLLSMLYCAGPLTRPLLTGLAAVGGAEQLAPGTREDLLATVALGLLRSTRGSVATAAASETATDAGAGVSTAAAGSRVAATAAAAGTADGAIQLADFLFAVAADRVDVVQTPSAASGGGICGSGAGRRCSPAVVALVCDKLTALAPAAPPATAAYAGRLVGLVSSALLPAPGAAPPPPPAPAAASTMALLVAVQRCVAGTLALTAAPGASDAAGPLVQVQRDAADAAARLAAWLWAPSAGAAAPVWAALPAPAFLAAFPACVGVVCAAVGDAVRASAGPVGADVGPACAAVEAATRLVAAAGAAPGPAAVASAAAPPAGADAPGGSAAAAGLAAALAAPQGLAALRALAAALQPHAGASDALAGACVRFCTQLVLFAGRE
jgi:hypothetical protein